MCRDDEIVTRSNKLWRVWLVHGAASERDWLLSTRVPFGGLSRFTSSFVPLVFSDDNIYTISEERITLTRKTRFPRRDTRSIYTKFLYRRRDYIRKYGFRIPLIREVTIFRRYITVYYVLKNK